jgi:hypothetical protein
MDDRHLGCTKKWPFLHRLSAVARGPLKLSGSHDVCWVGGGGIAPTPVNQDDV